MIYLDNAATTACHAEVVEAMMPFFRESFGNASSIDHLPGASARAAVDVARHQVAALIDARPEDVIFTSGSTEANNLAFTIRSPIITTVVEHPSILYALRGRCNDSDRLLKVDSTGIADLDELHARLNECGGRMMTSIIATNNETGVEHNIDALAKICNESESLLHLDATQAVITRRISMVHNNIAALSLSAHKIHGPKGVGALVAGSRFRRLLAPIMRGGGQERGLRSGTLNVPGIVGFGVAANILSQKNADCRKRLSHLRNLFVNRLSACLKDSVSESIPAKAASPHVLSLRFHNVNGRALLGLTSDTVAFSLGSACATGKTEPSHVLLAMGWKESAIKETVRFSFSHEQNEGEILQAASTIAEAAQKLAELSFAKSGV